MSDLSTESRFDLAIVGAGPAGMAAALEADGLGLTCVVLDEQPRPGGQIYRNIEVAAEGEAAAALGKSYAKGEVLVRAFRESAAGYRSSAVVWHIEAEEPEHYRVWYQRDDRVSSLTARRIILASGAQERPVPVPGWTLPGVMTVGALQVLLKTAAMTPDVPTVLVGNGPLLYLTAVQHRAAGGKVSAILLTGKAGSWRAALPHLPGFAASGAWWPGLALLRAFNSLKLPVVRGVSSLALEGDSRVRKVRYRTEKGLAGELNAELVGLHEGVIPSSNLARAMGCEHHWDERQESFRPALDDWFNSSQAAVQIIGDGGGISGADACIPAGRIAALEAARVLGRLTADERNARAAGPRRDLKRILRGRAFVDALYRPRLASGPLADEVQVCRCEEVTAGALRQAVAAGAQGPNQAKAFLRCGMGPCQGRFCGDTVSRLIAEARGVPREQIGYYRLRPPVKPIALRSFAASGEGEA